MNSETSKLPLLPIIYCRYRLVQSLPCEPPGTITDKSAAELLQSRTASNPHLKWLQILKSFLGRFAIIEFCFEFQEV